MRSLKELFRFILDADKDTREYKGICYVVGSLCDDGIITLAEYVLLCRYIYEHRPKWYSRHYCYANRNSQYYWPVRKWAPREKWIKAQIKYKL